jgi:hypothetical protein
MICQNAELLGIVQQKQQSPKSPGFDRHYLARLDETELKPLEHLQP